MSKITKERLNEIILREIEIERRIQREIDEGVFDSIFSTVSSIASGGIDKAKDSIGGAGKQFLAKQVLKAFGMEEGPLLDLLSNAVEALSPAEFRSLYRAEEGACDIAVDVMYTALLESIGENIFNRLPGWLEDIPVIGSAAGFLGSPGMISSVLNGIGSEVFEDQFSKEENFPGGWLRANIYPLFHSKVCAGVEQLRSQGITSLMLGNTVIDDSPSSVSSTAADVGIDVDDDGDSPGYTFPAE